MATHYLFREQWYGSVVATVGLSLDPHVILLQSMAFININRVSEALSLLEPLLNQLSAATAALRLMIYAHNSCEVIVYFLYCKVNGLFMLA